MLDEKQKRNLTRATIYGTLWSYASKYSGKVMVFISTLILARLLLQDEFGVAGYALVVISFLEVLTDLGIGPALIYHRLDSKRTNTAFWVSLGVGTTLFIVSAALVAPLAGDYFRDERAVAVVATLSLTFPLQSLGLVHDSLLRKELNFGRRFIPEFSRSVGKGMTSIVLAWLGFGYWSLIIGQLMGVATNVVALWIIVPWRPRFTFERPMVPSLLSYGVNIVAVDILGILLLNSDYLIIGRYFSAAALGVYTLAFRIPDLLINQFNVIIARVVFPAYSKMRDDPDALRRGFLQTMRYVSLITVPISIGLALTAEPFILVAFGEKWTEAIPVVPAIATYTLFRSIAFNIGDVYKAQGRPSLLTKLSIIQVIVLLPALYWAASVLQTIVAVGWVQAGVSFLGMVLNFIVAGYILKTSMLKMFAAVQPAATGGLLMALVVLSTQPLLADYAPLIQLTLTTLVGATIYLGSLWWLQREVVLKASRTLRTAFARR